MRLKALFLIAACAMVACDKPAPPAEPAATTAPTETAPDAPEPEPKAEPAAKDPAAAADFSKFTDDQWCPRAHADTAKIVEAMKATIKRSGNEVKDESAYEPPDAERFVTLCNKLPVEMRKCLVIGYATQNRQECQDARDGLDEGADATYNELMGK